MRRLVDQLYLNKTAENDFLTTDLGVDRHLGTRHDRSYSSKVKTEKKAHNSRECGGDIFDLIFLIDFVFV